MHLVSLAKNPAPSGAVVGSFKGHDGVALRYARWEPTQGPRRGTVCIFQGRAEYIEKYFETAADLRRRGFAVAVFDWRGQGASQRLLDNPRKGHVEDFHDYERDLVRFMKDIVLPDCLPPFYALAHSMGGNVLLRHAANPAGWFERLILSAPMVSISNERVGYPQSLVRSYARLGTLAGFKKSYVIGGSDKSDASPTFAGNVLTTDEERWARATELLKEAPELGLGSPTVGWLNAAYRSCSALGQPDFPGRIRIPALVFAAGEDRLVSTPDIERFASRLKVGRHILLPGARHEILHERDSIRQRFWAAFDAYLGVRSAAA